MAKSLTGPETKPIDKSTNFAKNTNYLNAFNEISVLMIYFKSVILKSLFKAGIILGISSRGLGSVKEVMGENTVEVQEDFELICFDLVSSPSTPGSYLFKNAGDADKYDEVLESKQEPNTLDNKADKALKLMSKLNNFLDR